MPKRIVMEPVSEDTARRIARVLGDSCAYAKALAQMDRRRELGEDVHIFKSGQHIVVGPDPSLALEEADGTDGDIVMVMRKGV